MARDTIWKMFGILYAKAPTKFLPFPQLCLAGDPQRSKNRTVRTQMPLRTSLRRISCHGRNHSQASCEYSLTIFLCCQHHSEYSLLGSKLSTNLLFAGSKCHTSQYNDVQFEMFKMAEPDGMVAVVKHCWLLVQGRRGCR